MGTKQMRLAMLAMSALVTTAYAQMQPCVNDAPNGYQVVNDWVQTPRPFAGVGSVYVDAKDNVWVFDRCGDKGCAGSNEAPIWELSPDGKVLKNFGAGLFVFPHGSLSTRKAMSGLWMETAKMAGACRLRSFLRMAKC